MADSAKFLQRYVTVEETWAHNFDPETKLQGTQLKHATSLTPVKFHKIASAGKVMASIFWHKERVLTIDYLQQKSLLQLSTVLR